MQRLIWVIATVAVAAIPSLGLGQATATGAEPRDALRAGDIIRLKIWREPDLTGDFTVAENGEAQLPKIGAVPATMLSADSLTRYIRKSYETYLRNPTIEITLLRRITISGAVQKPGLYPVDPTMTVSDAVALAGGATPDGRLDRVTLSRNGKRYNIELTASSRLSETPLASGDQLDVPLKSWLSRNASWLVSGGLAMVGVIVAVTR